MPKNACKICLKVCFEICKLKFLMLKSYIYILFFFIWVRYYFLRLIIQNHLLLRISVMTFDLVSKQICIPVVKDTEFGTRKI